MFTKADLKDGMVVETRKGDKFIVFKDILINERGYLELKKYKENLSFNDSSLWFLDYNITDYDIVKVWDIKGLFGLNYCFKLKPNIHPDDISLLYEEESKEMTLEEVEEKLGHKVKIVTKNE